MNFTNDVVIVTGGAQGIGREVVRGVLDGGGKVIIADINEAKANQTKSELGSDNIFVYKINLGDVQNVNDVFAQIIKDFGKVDVLVNCGGVVSTVPFEQLTDAEFDRTVKINLYGTYATNHALFEHFKENGGGRIVNVSSVAGKIGGGLLGTAAYATSKAGVNGLTKAVAKEGGKYGIRCNAVCPSYTETPMTQALKEDKEKEAKIINAIPLRRKAQPVEIAQMILFFASKEASFVNGEIGDVDGGIVLDG